ncbi:MAG: AMP-binding protein, partial [bacterium]|nr:AMP-binding protein [bacterium]
VRGPAGAFSDRNTPIGRPPRNTRIHLLDRRLQPVPAGVPGELHIAGAGVARGYLERPALTAERFIPNPLSGDPLAGIGSAAPGGRLYRTGDLVRHRPDGHLEFLGRIDHQVKIRGFRVELGEIEALLSEHPAVQEAIVLARDEVAALGEAVKILVAYVVPSSGSAVPDPVELRAFLAGRLPDYMVPSAVVLLEALPQTASGKVDRTALGRRALPALHGTAAAGAEEPRTPAEEILAGIWAEVLGCERVGVESDFFAIGGHSLLATQIVSRVRGTFGVELPLRRLFEAPTVAALARCIAETRRTERGVEIPPPVPVPRDRDLPLSFAQQRLWFIDQMDPGNPAYNLALPVRLRGRLDPAALAGGLSAVHRRHEVLRTTFTTRDGKPVQVIGPESTEVMALVDLRALPEATREREARRLARDDAARPFDLARGPLLRTAVLRLADDDHVFLLTMHHIV